MAGVTPNTVTHYLQSEWGLLAEADATGQVHTSYGWNPQRDNSVAPLYARVPDPANPGSPRYVYYRNDHLGTPQRIIDKAGNLVWAAAYDAYGKATVQPCASATLALTSHLRYPGQYFDAETGLHYNDRRYYDPDIGRYTQNDPIGLEGAGIGSPMWGESTELHRSDGPMGNGRAQLLYRQDVLGFALRHTRHSQGG